MLDPPAVLSPEPRPPELWAITSYFNPIGYKRRLENYRTFRRHLNVPLVAVELSFSNTFELGAGDADVLVQLRGKDILWQKERLLNRALEALPRECDKVAWLDADVLLADPHWPLAASRLLEQFPLIHLFRNFHALRQGCLAAAGPEGLERTLDSVAYEYASGALARQELGPHGAGSAGLASRRNFAWGLAWAARVNAGSCSKRTGSMTPVFWPATTRRWQPRPPEGSM